MPILDPVHDGMHPVETDSAWSESYYFNAYDPDSDTGLYTRIGIRPHEGTMDVLLAVWLPGREVAFARESRPQQAMCEAPFEVGGVRYACLEAGRHWRVTADRRFSVYPRRDGRPHEIALALDLELEALMPMIGVDGQGQEGRGASAATGQATGKGHFEQAGRWKGWIEAEGKRHVFGTRARGNRDKSWGPRRWGGPTMWRWLSINISDDVHFGGIRIGTAAGDLHRGWVWKDGEHTSISEWRLRTETHSDGVTQKTVHITALDKRGRTHALRADVMRVFPGGARPGRTVVNEGLARFTHEGETGYGIAEYLHQFDEQGKPLVPIE